MAEAEMLLLPPREAARSLRVRTLLIVLQLVRMGRAMPYDGTDLQEWVAQQKQEGHRHEGRSV